MNDENLPVVNPNDQLLQLAIDKDADIDKLEKLIQLKVDCDNRESKKQYNMAMVKAQASMPVVPRDKDNNQTHSKYSSYETILRYTKPIYTEHGFSISFFEGETSKDGHIRICANVMHMEGHTEDYFVDIPIDDKGIKGTVNKTQTHAKGSSISYGRGYLIKMVFNIPTGEDDDGNGCTPIKHVDEEQQANIQSLIDEVKPRMQGFYKHFNVKDISEIPATKYKQVINQLEAKRC